MKNIELRQLEVGNIVKVNSQKYKVSSYIVYEDEEKSTFIEYELVGLKFKKEKLWLCIGINYDEVLLFKQADYPDGERSLLNKGYELLDNLDAKVINFSDGDVELYECVNFKEFKHNEVGVIFSIETWEDEICYSESIPINKGDIEILIESEGISSDINLISNRKKVPYLKYILLLLIPVAIILISLISLNLSNKNFIRDYLQSDSSYIYDTSITSDADSKLKADIYTTVLSMDTTTEFIVNAAADIIEDVQSSDDEYSVAILTKYEYAIVYIGMDNKTYIQVSPREYVYTSNHDLYNAHYASSNIYYRDFYYTFGYINDSKKYKNRVTPYAGYVGSNISKNSSDKYRQLKLSPTSIKQSSLNSRTSSGGGLSSGK